MKFVLTVDVEKLPAPHSPYDVRDALMQVGADLYRKPLRASGRRCADARRRQGRGARRQRPRRRCVGGAAVTDAQRRAIEENKRLGLQCACGAVRVPYYGAKPGEHGTRREGGRVHGYDDCPKENES